MVNRDNNYIEHRGGRIMGFELFGITIQYVIVWMAIAIIFAVAEGMTLGLTAISRLKQDA